MKYVRSLMIGSTVGFALNAEVLAATFHVKTSATGMADGSTWGNACTLQYALDNSSTNDVIWVQSGTYVPTAEYTTGVAQSKTFLLTLDVKVFGGFAGTETALSQRNPLVNLTYLSGDLDSDGLDADNAWHVVRAESSGTAMIDTTRLDGFIITMGYADGGTSPNGLGGGLLIVKASPVIQNCVFINNYALVGGGGAHIEGDVNIFQEPAPPLAEPQFISCRFLGNTSDGEAGAACVKDGDTTFVNCVFSGNSADDDGGALYIHADAGQTGTPSEATVINCTFSNNEGNGRSAYNGNTLSVFNTIMWDTGSPADHIEENAHPSTVTTITDSNIEGDSGTLNSDPLFALHAGVDTTIGTLDDNLRIPCGSPSVDAGTDGDVPVDTYDVDDDGTTGGEATPTVDRVTRIQNGDVDHGAYETIPDACPADHNNDGCVNVTDLLAVIGSWGTCSACAADVAPPCVGDGQVNVTDLLAVIGAWGACPGQTCGVDEIPDISGCEEECDGLTGQAWIDCMEECLGGS